MKIHKFTFYSLVLFFAMGSLTVAGQNVSNKLKWSQRMAATIMIEHPQSYMIDHANQPKWDYVHGLVLKSFQVLNQKYPNTTYENYVQDYLNQLIQNDGSIKGYAMESYNIDMVVAGRLLFDAYSKTKNKSYLTSLQNLREQLKLQPRTASGGFWHKKIYPNQMWLDGLYMGAPFYAQYTTTFEQGANWSDIVKQFELIQKNVRDNKTGLFYHAWDESKQMPWSNKQTGTSPNFWSRSLGWYAMALVDVLDYMPKDHPKRQQLIQYLDELTKALVPFQDQSGLWYQVTDKGNTGGNYLEGSGSAMFSYALAKGANKGYINKKYKKIALKAFNGIVSKLVKVDSNGKITITQVCAVAGLGGTPYRDGSFEYYVNEKKKDNDPKATGPFILAALELNK